MGVPKLSLPGLLLLTVAAAGAFSKTLPRCTVSVAQYESLAVSRGAVLYGLSGQSCEPRAPEGVTVTVCMCASLSAGDDVIESIVMPFTVGVATR